MSNTLDTQYEWLDEEWIKSFISTFKEHFARDFNYLPENPSEDIDTDDYISDDDIKKALHEALAIFPCEIFETAEIRTLALLYLTAHYLCEDIRNALQGIASVGSYPATNRTVRNVSESYSLPSWILNNPTLSYISETGYGKKYLSLYWPRTVGRIRVVGGWTLA